MIEEFTKEEVESVVAQNGWILADFHADWCKPCQRMHPVLDKLQNQFLDVEFLKVNSDNESELAAEMKIRSIPTLIMFRTGAEVARWEGGQDESEIRRWIINTMLDE